MIPAQAVEAAEEQFCDNCWAGVESNEHHEKCVAPTELSGDAP